MYITQQHTKQTRHEERKILQNSTLTLLNGRTLTATLTQSLLCMSEALALMVQQAGSRLSDQLPPTEQHNTVSSYTLTWTPPGQRVRESGVDTGKEA